MSSVFLGAGLHTALGADVDSCVAALRGPLPQASTVSCKFAGAADEIPYFLLANVSADDPRSRMDDILFGVIEQALQAANLSASQRGDLALFLGSSSFDIASEERRYRQAFSDHNTAIPLAQAGMGNLAEHVRSRLGIRGEDYTFNTACTSSANALWYASKLIDAKVIEHALIVGVEFINDTTTYGFQGLQLLSPTAMRPFDERRNGLVLGESCSAMVIGKSEKGEGFRLRGGANLCDTYSMSTTREDGSVVSEVISQAMSNAGLTPGDIHAIKCHGTATWSGDAAEAEGLLKTFEQLPPCTTLKPFIGHTLGACGLAELILFCGAIERGFLPGTPGFVAEEARSGFTLNQHPRRIEPGNFMLNYFGFGGNSTSLVVSNLPEGVA
ncbi:beta-ketoacyl synthase [Proteobacteria bacterium 005FR1]|nr:beta-ketoacyl synthase [Proteobacteria bacterium 005FR1]